MYDILFSKEALQLADKANAFKALMIQTALESLEENGKTKLKNAQGKYDYTILKNMLYKGKIVRPHRMKKELPEKKHKDEAAKAEKKPALAKREPAPKQPEDPSKPKVTFVHRGDLDFAACLGSAGSMDQPITRRPKELLVRLELPKLQSAADMELDIKGSFLEFSVPGTYQLKQKLPFPVDEASGDAKYNKTQKVLTVTLTVLPWTKEEAMEELQLAAKAREEAERKAREAEEARRLREAADAKRVVKRGFLAGAVKFPVNRQDQRCVFRNHQCLRADLNALCAHSLDLIHQMPRVKHNTIADHAQLTAAHHTRRQRMQLVNFAINNKRMARIVPALKARNHIRALGKPVHNLAFALVAPLCADNHYICHTGPLRFCVEFSVKPALVYRAASRGETPN